MDEVIEALHDPRAIRTLELALRDARIRRRFRQLGRDMTVIDACEVLAEEFYLSPERIKSIVYDRRRVSGPHKAVERLKLKIIYDEALGRNRTLIVGGKATWAGQSLVGCQAYIDRFGVSRSSGSASTRWTMSKGRCGPRIASTRIGWLSHRRGSSGWPSE